MEPLRLAICDDLPEEREALLALLEQAPIATVCAQFASSEELLEAFRPGAEPGRAASAGCVWLETPARRR